MKKNKANTTFRNEKLFCLNCGGEQALIMPIAITEMQKKIKAFDKLHANCEKDWTQPVMSQEEIVHKRAMFWMANGETGSSSKTMWHCFMGTASFPIYHPCDPDDFSRCYKLLEQIPEWKNSIRNLSSLSWQWKNLVENWAELTRMYEQNEKEGWKNSKEIGMYKLMEKLLKY